MRVEDGTRIMTLSDALRCIPDTCGAEKVVVWCLRNPSIGEEIAARDAIQQALLDEVKFPVIVAALAECRDSLPQYTEQIKELLSRKTVDDFLGAVDLLAQDSQRDVFTALVDLPMLSQFVSGVFQNPGSEIYARGKRILLFSSGLSDDYRKVADNAVKTAIEKWQDGSDPEVLAELQRFQTRLSSPELAAPSVPKARPKRVTHKKPDSGPN